MTAMGRFFPICMRQTHRPPA